MLTGGAPERDFIAALKQLLERSHRILDIGTPARFHKELRPRESLFQGKEYIAAGYNPQKIYGVYNCDCHQDIEAMTFADASFDAVICIDVLEHVRDPFKAVAEIKRVLRPQGTALIITPFLHAYHGKGGKSQSHEEVPDFWRFTHQGMQKLFDDFSSVTLTPLDGPIEFRLKYLLPGWVGFKPIRLLLDSFDPRRVPRNTTRQMLYGIK